MIGLVPRMLALADRLAAVEVERQLDAAMADAWRATCQRRAAGVRAMRRQLERDARREDAAQ